MFLESDEYIPNNLRNLDAIDIEFEKRLLSNILCATLFNRMIVDDDVDISIQPEHQTNLLFIIRFKHPERLVAHFRLSEMPGCCGMLISYNSHIYYDYRRNSLGALLHRYRIQLARRLGYTAIISTDVENNPAQSKILKRHGWKKIWIFTNMRTGHGVLMHCKNVCEKTLSVRNGLNLLRKMKKWLGRRKNDASILTIERQIYNRLGLIYYDMY